MGERIPLAQASLNSQYSLMGGMGVLHNAAFARRLRHMEVAFDDKKLQRLYTDPQATAGFGQAIERGFRKVMAIIVSAADERDLHALRGLRFEKLKGQRAHQHSLRINDQFRLVIEIRADGARKIIVVLGIEDYH